MVYESFEHHDAPDKASEQARVILSQSFTDDALKNAPGKPSFPTPQTQKPGEEYLMSQNGSPESPSTGRWEPITGEQHGNPPPGDAAKPTNPPPQHDTPPPDDTKPSFPPPEHPKTGEEHLMAANDSEKVTAPQITVLPEGTARGGLNAAETGSRTGWLGGRVSPRNIGGG